MSVPNDHAFAESFNKYWTAGWRSVLPITHRKKFSPPTGTTGRNAQPLSYPDLQTYADEALLTNIALHMADTFIGIDVDAYGDKPGAATLAALEDECGALPPTFVSTARPGTISGIRVFRAPAGVKFITALAGIEICQPHHRYVMCWPSWNPNAGATYVWVDQASGEVLDHPPNVAVIPELPAAWVERLRAESQQTTQKHDLDDDEVSALLAGLPTGEACEHIRKAAGNALTGIARHDAYLKAQLAVLGWGRTGCPGALTVIERLQALSFAELTTGGGSRRTPDEADREWRSGLVGAVQIVAAKPQGTGCPAYGNDEQGGADSATPSARKVTLTSAATIKPRRVRWLWKERMALGALSLVAGPEGLGKSTLVYSIVADVTRGKLPGEHHGTPHGVLIAATEDSWEHTIIPRLMAAGAALERVYRVDVTTTLGTDGTLSLPADIPALGQAAKEVDAALLVLDPLTSRLNAGLDTHKDSETRLALEPLVGFADRSNVAVIGIMHFNKSGSTDPLALVMASKAFTAVARSVSTVIRDPDDETESRRLFGTVKNNLGRTDLPTRTFTIVGHCVSTDDGDAWTGKLVWGDDAAGSIGDALTRGADSNDDRSATSEAAAWLSDYLETEGGTADSALIKREGKKAGHNESALQRARKRLNLSTAAKGMPRRTEWSMPENVQSFQPPRGDEMNEMNEMTGECGDSVVSVVSVVSMVSGQGTGETTVADDKCPDCAHPPDSRLHTIECATAQLLGAS